MVFARATEQAHPVTLSRSSALWHPVADMAAVSAARFMVDRAEGAWVWDTDNRPYLDASAGLWFANLGHRRPEVIEAVERQMNKLDSYMIFNDYTNRPAEDLAERLAQLAPVDEPKIALGSGGGDGIETAAKLARAHWALHGQPGKVGIVARVGAYHGSHAFATSIGGLDAFRLGWGPLIPYTTRVPYDDVDLLEAEILSIGPDRVAAFFCEPVVGGGAGVLAPPDGYLEAAAAVCARHNVLFIADEVICAFGRLGTWFGIERWGVRPDMIVFAKAVTGGILPLGGVIVSAAIAEPYWRTPGGPVLRHGVTYSGHPACCAAALAVLDIYEREGLIQRGAELEGPLAEALRPLEDHWAVREVRAGTGFIGAVELRADLLDLHPDAVGLLHRATREAGVVVRPFLKGVAVSPPLVTTNEEIQLIPEAIRVGLDALEQLADLRVGVDRGTDDRRVPATRQP